MTREDANKRILLACKRTWNEKTCEEIFKALEQELSGDLISRQAVLETLDDMDNVLDEDRTIENYKELLKECYEVLPPVTPQEKTGHWEEVSEEYIQVYDLNGIPSCGDERICSECGFETVFIGEHCSQYKFCPSCGAKMVEPQESEDK